MNIDRLIQKATAAQANKDARGLPKSHTRRVKSTNEAKAEYHQPGYGNHFCLHDRSYYEVCTKCRRSKMDAKRNLSNL